MDYSLVALTVSVLVNAGLALYVYFKEEGKSAAQVLSEFKVAVLKVKAAKDKAAVDAVAYSAGIPQVLDLLNPK